MGMDKKNLINACKDKYSIGFIIFALIVGIMLGIQIATFNVTLETKETTEEIETTLQSLIND